MFGSKMTTYGKFDGEVDSPEAASKWILQLDADLARLRAICDAFHNNLVQERLRVNYEQPQNMYQPGDFVLLSRMHKVKDKNDPLFAGPYEVVKHDVNEVTVQDLIRHSVKVLHVDQLKMFHGDFAAAFDLAMLDDDQHMVVSITAHRGDPLVRRTMEFELLFADGDTVWQPWGSNVYDLAAYQVYCDQQQELWSLLLSFADAKLAMRHLLQQAEDDLKIGDTVFFNLRYFGDLTYQSFGATLPDIDHVKYFMKWTMHDLSRNKRKVTFLFAVLHKLYVLNAVDVKTYVHKGALTDKDVLVDISFLRKYPNLHIP
jgi:hypothetical protein